jgi:antitoxin component YwqK of YwqJK toxin-antitoxin module
MIKKFIFWVFVISVFQTYGQSDFYCSQRRKIILAKDSVQHIFEIKTEMSQLKTDPFLTYYWYNKTGLHQSQGFYSGYLLDGEFMDIELSGNIIIKGALSNGLKNGIWVVNNKKDGIMQFQTWRNGVQHGKLEEYNSDHQLIKTCSFKNGLQHGWYILYENNIIITKTYFRNGIEVGPNRNKFKQLFTHNKTK